MKKEKEVLNTIKTRKLQYLGQLTTSEKHVLLETSMTAKIQGIAISKEVV